MSDIRFALRLANRISDVWFRPRVLALLVLALLTDMLYKDRGITALYLQAYFRYPNIPDNLVILVLSVPDVFLLCCVWVAWQSAWGASSSALLHDLALVPISSRRLLDAWAVPLIGAQLFQLLASYIVNRLQYNGFDATPAVWWWPRMIVATAASVSVGYLTAYLVLQAYRLWIIALALFLYNGVLTVMFGALEVAAGNYLPQRPQSMDGLPLSILVALGIALGISVAGFTLFVRTRRVRLIRT